ncbi:hypothetical protein AV530_015653 [Patagioenas fasciata monilis]|uniref:Uncharacterized protein n=1 Tax=Patagioenas fasciata monilis TaxID=372326 RepID=A0A1V4KI70_PATFA|nr:hypothetical protein AV530_015653 [Patagioenas fasciata monilis]
MGAYTAHFSLFGEERINSFTAGQYSQEKMPSCRGERQQKLKSAGSWGVRLLGWEDSERFPALKKNQGRAL